jgi:Lamin Tail Domain
MTFEIRHSLITIKKIMIAGICIAALLLYQAMYILQAHAAVSMPTNKLQIFQIQTGSSSSASQEFISIYNSSNDPVSITDYCLVYASASDATQTQLACIKPPNSQTTLHLAAYRAATFASNEFIQSSPYGFVPDYTFTAGIATNGGHIKLLNAAKSVVDQIGWGTAVHPEGAAAMVQPAGMVLQRISNSYGELQDTNNNAADIIATQLEIPARWAIFEETIAIDVCANIDGDQEVMPEGHLTDITGNCTKDVCTNIDGLQVVVPERFNEADGICSQPPLESRVLFLTEILPNPAGADTGNEYIEIYNPHDQPVSLNGYKLQVGPGYAKSYSLPNITLTSRTYKALNDKDTGITLPNTSASLRLLAPNGEIVNTSDAYNDPADGAAWSYFNDDWYVSYQPTPNQANSILSVKLCQAGYIRNEDTGHCRLATSDDEVDSPALCLPGQERNPETNRCRKIATVAALLACKIGQIRNPETGRCRSTIAANSAVACKAGQVRNPATGRCHKSTENTAPKDCPAGQQRNAETNRCRKVTGAAGSGKLATVKDVASPLIQNNAQWWVAGIGGTGSIGYGVYEWRREVLNYLLRLKDKLPLS